MARKPKVDFKTLTSVTELAVEDAEDRALLEAMITRARNYLELFGWCREVVETYVSEIAGGRVVAVLLFRIVPAREGVDEWLWVIVGDLPPAYLPTDGIPSAAAALADYIDEMQLWVDAAKTGRSIEELIPVETNDGSMILPPSPELALALEGRLAYLAKEILGKKSAGAKRRGLRR
jgi:hypothetical protein